MLIAIDAKRHIPLRVEVFGRGSAGLVYSVGFTSLTFGTPAASNFSFTPPPGATVKRESVPSSFGSVLKQAGLGPAVLPGVHVGFGGVSNTTGMPGKAPAALPVPKRALAKINAEFAKSLPKSLTKAQRAKAIQQFDKHFTIATGKSAANGGGFFKSQLAVQAGGPKVIGTDWLSVVATPPSPQVAAAVQSLLSGKGPAMQPPSGQGGFGSSVVVRVGVAGLQLGTVHQRRPRRPVPGRAACAAPRVQRRCTVTGAAGACSRPSCCRC